MKNSGINHIQKSIPSFPRSAVSIYLHALGPSLAAQLFKKATQCYSSGGGTSNKFEDENGRFGLLSRFLQNLSWVGIGKIGKTSRNFWEGRGLGV